MAWIRRNWRKHQHATSMAAMIVSIGHPPISGSFDVSGGLSTGIPPDRFPRKSPLDRRDSASAFIIPLPFPPATGTACFDEVCVTGTEMTGGHILEGYVDLWKTFPRVAKWSCGYWRYSYTC